ncbi:VOC family protein [Streptosporangium sp. NPDC087985]|uniref:VOC family protein n=1 Tax=Streptosporangium sp. NPDC087985 TaxID=3366196 RepID=UPI00381B6CA1
MDQEPGNSGKRLSRREISEAVHDLGWRYVLGVVRTSVPVASLTQAAEVAARAVAAAGDGGEVSLWMDLRRDRVVLTLQSPATGWVTPLEIELAHRISAVVSRLGLRTDAEVDSRGSRSVQMVELAIDALDIAAIRPFWKAVMGYGDEAGASGSTDPLVDPVGQGPAIWFQQMDGPRPQRNRIHLDISVPHDEAPHRVKAALAVGGVLLSDTRAPAFWVLADAEGNEACVTTWQGRD